MSINHFWHNHKCGEKSQIEKVAVAAADAMAMATRAPVGAIKSNSFGKGSRRKEVISWYEECWIVNEWGRQENLTGGTRSLQRAWFPHFDSH